MGVRLGCIWIRKLQAQLIIGSKFVLFVYVAFKASKLDVLEGLYERKRPARISIPVPS